jgi:hypothetical protein
LTLKGVKPPVHSNTWFRGTIYSNTWLREIHK